MADRNGVEAWRQLHQRWWAPRNNRKRFGLVMQLLTHKSTCTATGIQNRMTRIKSKLRELHGMGKMQVSLEWVHQVYADIVMPSRPGAGDRVQEAG